MNIENIENCVIPILFNKANKEFTKVYDELLRPYELTKFHGFYLICLQKNPQGLKLNDINHILGCDKANTSRAITDLEVKGFINKCCDNCNEKKYVVKLTDKGREIADRFIENIREFNKSILNKLTEDEQMQLVSLIKKMYGE